MRVEWRDLSEGETEFVIARAVVEGASATPVDAAFVIVGAAQSEATSFEDTDVEAGVFYVYSVAAGNVAGRSTFVRQTGGAVFLTPNIGSCGTTPSATDTDGDGLSDAVEATGWTVRIDEDGKGTLSERPVKSDAFDADTDHDGLCDAEESALKLDPRRSDTDGDGLTDGDEINRWGSSATNVDSDGDSTGNSLFYDGAELRTFRTSPTLADTDGDGRSDFEEINQNGTNPLIAELPRPKIDFVGAIDIGVDVILSNNMTVTDAVTTSLERSNTLSSASETSVATSQTTESTVTISTEATAGYPFSAGVEMSASYSESSSFVQESSASWSRGSSASSQEAYERLTSTAIEESQEIAGGRIAMNIEISNDSTRTFELDGLTLTALQRDRNNPASFVSIATLTLPEAAGSLVLGEGDRAGPFRVEANIPANVALDLLANPSATFIRAASYQLTDRTGENFAFSVGEETSNRTALITLDFGGLRPVETYRVATNVERGPDGRTAGVKMRDVIEQIIGLPRGLGYETTARSDGVRVLTKLRTVEAAPRQSGGAERFWAIFAAPNPNTEFGPVDERLLDRAKSFEDLTVMPRDSIFIAFLADRDEDGLFDREERLYGTFDELTDSDGDLLSDFEEAREGWIVPADLPFYRVHPRVFSNPAVIDADRDGWDDRIEQLNQTDPNRRDTDQDGLLDSLDPKPVEGPSGDFVRVLGTNMDDAALFVATSSDTIFVLGTSAGDIDNDGTNGGPFVLALNGEDGARLWAVQLEGTTEYARQIVADESGNVTWAAEVQTNVLPGASRFALYGLQWDRSGTLRAINDMTDRIGTGSLPPDRIRPTALAPRFPSGAILFNGYTNFANQPAFQLIGLDAAAAYDGGSAFSIGSPDTLDAAANGRLIAVSNQVGAGCRIDLIGAGLAFVGPSMTFCGQRPGVPRHLGLDSAGAIYAAIDHNGDSYLERIATDGSTIWRYEPAAPNDDITSVDVDGTDQIYVGRRLRANGSFATLDILRSDRLVLDTMELGNATTAVSGIDRDFAGNLFTVITSAGGFDAHGASLGGTDLILIRNPQRRFGR